MPDFVFFRRFTAFDSGPPPSHATSVLIPLSEAHLHSHSARKAKVRRINNRQGADEDDDDLEDMTAQLLSGSGGGGNGGILDGTTPSSTNGKDVGEAAELHERTVMLEESRPAEYSIEGLRREMRKGRVMSGAGWTDYELKAKLINKAIQDIGMGRYNWQLFVLCGFGWFADNLWLQGVSLTLPSLSAEFGVGEKTVRYTTSSLFLGLCAGAFCWGVGSDILGRRIAFNATLLITASFGLLSSLAPSWGVVCLCFCLLGFGVGGNLPVDGALFLEFLPDASSSLLTLLSVWWPIGQLVSSILAWVFIAHWPADEGWRLFVVAIGIVTFVMFGVRFFAFRLLESPKFLLSKGRQGEAVSVVHGIAYRNGVKTWLTEGILDAVAEGDDDHELDQAAGGGLVGGRGSGAGDGERGDANPYAGTRPRRLRRRLSFSTSDVIKRKLTAFSTDRLRPLFKTRKLGLATALIWFCWATIGMGYPLFNAFLPQYFSHGEDNNTNTTPLLLRAETDQAAPALTSQTYRNYAITSIAGVPGSLLAAYTVDHPSPFLGRRGTLAISTLVSALFLFLFVSFGNTPTAKLAFSCVEAFAQNIMYGVLYAFTPEMFPAPVRGAGTGVASFLNRAAGLVAPVIAATVPGDGTEGPVYVAAGLILAAFLGMVGIPIETRGRQRL